MKKRYVSLLSVALAAVMLLLSSCTGGLPDDTSQTETTVFPDDTGIDEITDYEELRSMIENLDITSADAVSAAFAMYDGLSFEEKCKFTYAEFKKLTDAEYAIVNGDLIAGVNEHKPDVIAAAARAYFNQSYETWENESVKPQTQYDQYNSRRNFNAAPEDATAQRTMYLDCSSFVNSVYFYVFGRNLLEPGKTVNTKNINADMSTRPVGPDKELLYYITGDVLEGLKSDPASAEALIAEIKSVLQPGDVINYYRADTGHIVMYLGDGKIIHSTGTANAKTSAGGVDPKTSLEKATKDEARFGTINIDDWDKFFTTKVTAASQNDGRVGTTNNYIFAQNISAVAIFRPADDKVGRMRTNDLTSHSIARYLYDGLNIEKAATVLRDGKTTDLYYGRSVYAGDEITFTVTLVNTSKNEMKSVTAEEEIPTGFDFVSASDTGAYFADDGKICFHVSTLGAGEKFEVTYVLKVKDGLSGGSVIEDSLTLVNGIRTNKLIYQVAHVKVDAKKFGNTLDTLLGTKYDNVIKAAGAIYGALDDGHEYTTLKSLASPKDVIDKYLKTNEIQLSDKTIGMVGRVLYGGYSVGSGEVTAGNKTLQFNKCNLRVRHILPENLEDGDIICTYTTFGGFYNAYIYYNRELYGLDASGALVKIDPATAAISSGTTLTDYLDTLTAYNRFLILRPALVG